MKAFVVLAALTLAGCATIAAPADPTAGLGQWAFAGSLKVRPLAIVEDSRCPINAICVWAGRLVVRTEIRGGDWRETRDLELRKPQPIADGQLTLMEAPSKRAVHPTDPRAYRFTFAFEGGL
jgi:hypothetical protein